MKKTRTNVLRITGGLGNQLSAYAYARCVAAAKGVDVKFDTTPYRTAKLLGWPMHNGYELGEIFSIDMKASLAEIVRAGGLRYYTQVVQRKLKDRSDIHHAPVYVEPRRHRCTYQEAYKNQAYTYYHGFFIHYQYFRECETELRQTLTFPVVEDEANKDMLERVAANNTVAVHLRRADKGQRLYGADLAYYKRAVVAMQERVANPHFFVFSNDPDWCKETLKLKHATYVTHNTGQNAFRDMQLMSACQHLIMPASTFSFWAGLLKKPQKEAVIVCPQAWYRREDQREHEPCPPEWLRI